MKKILFVTLIALVQQNILAQVGIGTTNPNSDSILELSAPDKGFLINRVALSATNTPTPLVNHVEGMIVYNTATSIGLGIYDVTPGLYYNSGTAWEKLTINSQAPKLIGREIINTTDGTFTKVNTDFIWTSGNGISRPSFKLLTEIFAPYGSSTSYITVNKSTSPTVPDSFTCSKNIIGIRYYTHMQLSSPSSTSRWRTNLFLNGVSSGTGQYWGAPPNNVNNMRVFGSLEYGAIPAGTNITVKVDANTLPNTVQNNGSYFIVEYEL